MWLRTGVGLIAVPGGGPDAQAREGRKGKPYAKTVEFGLNYLKGKQKANGSFGTRDLYGHAIATWRCAKRTA